jgi:hypothetical protein
MVLCSARIGLRADADREMVDPGERPEVAWRIGHDLNDDFVAHRTISEKARGD